MQKINSKEENKIVFFVILIITIILGNQFLKMHFSSDTYVLFDLGYMEYPSQYFLLDGRIISSLVCYTAGILNIPYNIYIIGMDFIAICLLSTTIFIFYRKIVEIIRSRRTSTQTINFNGFLCIDF